MHWINVTFNLRGRETFPPCVPKASILNLHTEVYRQKTHKPHRSCSRETQAHRSQTVHLKKHKHEFNKHIMISVSPIRYYIHNSLSIHLYTLLTILNMIWWLALTVWLTTEITSHCFLSDYIHGQREGRWHIISSGFSDDRQSGRERKIHVQHGFERLVDLRTKQHQKLRFGGGALKCKNTLINVQQNTVPRLTVPRFHQSHLRRPEHSSQSPAPPKIRFI